MQVRDRNEIIFILLIIIGLFTLLYSFPPYAVSFYVPTLIGTLYGIFAIISYLRESKTRKDASQRLVFRLPAGGIMMIADIIRNNGV